MPLPSLPSSLFFFFFRLNNLISDIIFFLTDHISRSLMTLFSLFCFLYTCLIIWFSLFQSEMPKTELSSTLENLQWLMSCTSIYTLCEMSAFFQSQAYPQLMTYWSFFAVLKAWAGVTCSICALLPTWSTLHLTLLKFIYFFQPVFPICLDHIEY